MISAKELEKKIKHIFIAILRYLLKSSNPSRQPYFQKILFIRYGGLGDMILSIPVFKTCRLNYPSSRFDVLCDVKNADPIKGCELINNIYFYEKNPFKIINLIFKLRHNNYNYICNLVAYPSLTFGLLARLIGPNITRSGGDQQEFCFLYNRLITLPPKREINMLDRLFLLSSDLTGSEVNSIEVPWIKFNKSVESEAKSIYENLKASILTRGSEPSIVFVNLSAGLKRREWSEDRFVEFLHQAKEKYKDIIDAWAIFTFPNEPGKCKRVIEQLNDDSFVQIPLIKDFRIVMELLKYCYLLISPDTAFVHAASSMGAPVLDLIIGENAITWVPMRVKYQLVISKDELSLEKLQVKDVVTGFDKLMKQLHT